MMVLLTYLKEAALITGGNSGIGLATARLSLRRARRSPLLVATRRCSMKKDDERQASTALDLALGESDRFSQAIGACDGHVRTTDDNAPYRNGRPGIARELQSPSAGVSRSARGRLFRDSESMGRRLCTVLAAARIHRAGDDQRGLCVLAGAA